MILTGQEITHRVKTGEIVISPFRPENVNPNSYNFTLSDTLRVYENAEIDVRKEQPSRTIQIGPEGIVLEPQRLYLASTVEKLGSTHFVPTYAARSSVARLGMFINLSASLGDIGFIGCWTLQLLTMHPIRVYAGMCIGQMMFWKTKGRIELYDGKYQGARGVLTSRLYQDFEQEVPLPVCPPAEPVVETTIVNAPHTAPLEI
jgi:dCTP deaminase